MKRRMILGAALAASLPSAGLANRLRKEQIEVLETHLANPSPDARTPAAGQRLRLRRIRDWAFDPAAISVETEEGRHLGYLPPVQAGVLSRLLDNGAEASARSVAAGRVRVLLHLS